LALGETGILQGILVLFVLFPATVWTLARSFTGRRNVFMVICAITASVFGIWGIKDCVKVMALDWHVPEDWPPSGVDIFVILFSLFLLLAGVVSVLKMWKVKRTETSEKTKTSTP
jgi:phosphatidylglycerophosphate synthase